jgi:hypothetical protein
MNVKCFLPSVVMTASRPQRLANSEPRGSSVKPGRIKGLRIKWYDLSDRLYPKRA